MITTRRYFGQVDRRSRFTTVSMGWRTASDGVPRLRDAVTRAGGTGRASQAAGCRDVDAR